MLEQEDVDLPSPDKHLKITSTYGTILTENWLEIGR